MLLCSVRKPSRTIGGMASGESGACLRQRRGRCGMRASTGRRYSASSSSSSDSRRGRSRSSISAATVPSTRPAISARMKTSAREIPLAESGRAANCEIEIVGSPSRTFSSWRTRSDSVCLLGAVAGSRESCARVVATARSISGLSVCSRAVITACT